jgi:hypothetical protein
MPADALSRPPASLCPPGDAQQPPATPPTFFFPVAKDWPEEGLAALERPVLAAIADVQAVDSSAMSAAQRSCPEVKEMMNSDTLQIATQAVGGTPLLGDISTGVFCPLVPIQCREVVFQSLASIHQPGMRSTHRLITARFFWPQMAKAKHSWPGRACLASAARFTSTSTYNQHRYWFLTAVSPTSTLTCSP